MKRNNALIAIAAVGGFLFLASKAKASDEALKPLRSPLYASVRTCSMVLLPPTTMLMPWYSLLSGRCA